MDIDPVTQETPENAIPCGTVGSMMDSTPMQSLRWDSGKWTAVKAAAGLLQRFGRLLTAKDAVAVVIKERCGQDPKPRTVQQRLR